MSLLRFFVGVPIALGLLIVAGPAFAQYGDLVRRIPNSANAIVLLNVDQTHNSPLGQKENWRANHEQEFAAGLVIVPPHVGKFVMAAQFDIDTFEPRWQVAVMDLEYEASMPKIAATYNGTVDDLGGRPVAVLPGDVCVVRFGPKMGGMMMPAVRQEVARWLNAIDANETGHLSPYMQASVGFAENGAPLIVAMDLKDTLSAADLRRRLAEMECLKGRNVDLDQLSQAIASIEGVSLGITFGEKRFGKIKVDFGQDVSQMRDFAGPLLLEVLGNRGVMVDEFATWQVAVNGRQITLEGDLYQSGMRRILSLLDAPPAISQQVQDSAQAAPDDEQARAKLVTLASQQYYRSIVSLLDDLRSKRNDTDFVTWNQVGTWFDKYARKIDRMPILNVDPELLEYGAFVSDSFRDIESALKGIAPQTKLRQTQVPNYTRTTSYSAPIGVTRWGAYGWGGYTTQSDLARRGQEMSRIRTQERIRGNVSAGIIIQGLEQATADVRRQMTEKYGVEF